MQLIAFLLRYFRRYLPLVALGVVAALLYAISTAGIIALIEPIFTEVLVLDPADSALGPLGVSVDGGGDKGRLALVDLRSQFARGYEWTRARFGIEGKGVLFFAPLLLLAVFFVRSFMHFVSGFTFQRIGLGVTNDIRNHLYRRILGQSSRFHAEYPSGELISRIVNDIGLMQTAVSHRVVDLVQQTLTLVMLATLLLSTHFRLALICLVALPAFMYPIFRFGKGMRRTSFRSQERMADIASLMGEGVRGHRVVKAFGMEEFEYQRFRGATGQHLRVNLWAQMLATLSSPVVESVGVTLAVGLIIYAGHQIQDQKFSSALFLAFIINLFWMYEPLRKLNRVNLVLQQSVAAVQRVHALMEVQNEITEVEDPQTLSSVEEGIAFRDVSFGYEDNTVLKNIDLEIRKGRSSLS